MHHRKANKFNQTREGDFIICIKIDRHMYLFVKSLLFLFFKLFHFLIFYYYYFVLTCFICFYLLMKGCRKQEDTGHLAFHPKYEDPSRAVLRDVLCLFGSEITSWLQRRSFHFHTFDLQDFIQYELR